MDTTIYLKAKGKEFGVTVLYSYYKEYFGSDIEPPAGEFVDIHHIYMQDASGEDLDLIDLFSDETVKLIISEIQSEEAA